MQLFVAAPDSAFFREKNAAHKSLVGEVLQQFRKQTGSW